jgi:hypothetical protein
MRETHAREGRMKDRRKALEPCGDASPVGGWTGALRLNPDYHPAGAFLTATVGPVYVEAFTSDVLGARLMGAEAALDLAHLFTGPPAQPGRYTLALSAVHDWGRAGGASTPVTLAHVDGTAVLVVRPGFEMHALAGWGGRPGVGGAWGAVAGVGADALTPTLDMKLRLEARRQQGGFRQGFFGPDYELARFRAAGPSGLPVVEAPFPDGYSALGEVVLSWDAVRLGGAQRHLHFSLATEVFSWGRVDVDGRLVAQLAPHRRVEVALTALAMGAFQPGARYLYSGEARWRFGRWVYAVAQGGTLLFPSADGTLRPGAFASLGLGVDHAR